jgi:hypothetical protein
LRIASNKPKPVKPFKRIFLPVIESEEEEATEKAAEDEDLAADD